MTPFGREFAAAGAKFAAGCTWECTRSDGHDGPCALVPVSEPAYVVPENADYERAVDAATEAVMDGWALVSDRTTPLSFSEAREVIGHAIKVFCEEAGDPTHIDGSDDA